MKIKRIILLIITSIFFLLLSTQAAYAIDPSFALTTYEKPEHWKAISKISPFSAKTGWRYKVINGILYKRLYDYTNKRWIGNWIRA